MQKQTKYISIAIAIILNSLVLTTQVLAQDLTKVPATDIGSLFYAISRLVNLLVGLSSAVFIVMIFMTAIKFATSVDDPRGLDSAKQTGTMAIVGFIVVLGFFFIVRALATAFGLNEALLSPTQMIITAAQDLINFTHSASNASIWDSP